MKSKTLKLIRVLLLSALLLPACNLPSRQNPRTTTPALAPATIDTPTPALVCENQYFPDKKGNSWSYSGTNSATGTYTRQDIITSSEADRFTMETQLTSFSYQVSYTCSSVGLAAADPVEQYAGLILSSPDTPVSVKLGDVSGITLPAQIKPGDTWQQVADFNASSTNLTLNGRLVFNYTAVGFENVSVPYGSFNALRVDATIRIELTGLRILAGTYTTSLWMAPGVGLVKSEGTSHIPRVDFSDSMELTAFSSSQ